MVSEDKYCVPIYGEKSEARDVKFLASEVQGQHSWAGDCVLCLQETLPPPSLSRQVGCWASPAILTFAG